MKHWTSNWTRQSSAPATASLPFIRIYLTSLSVLLLIAALFVFIVTWSLHLVLVATLRQHLHYKWEHSKILLSCCLINSIDSFCPWVFNMFSFLSLSKSQLQALDQKDCLLAEMVLINLIFNQRPAWHAFSLLFGKRQSLLSSKSLNQMYSYSYFLGTFMLIIMSPVTILCYVNCYIS